MIPGKAIHSPEDLKQFIESPAYKELNAFIRSCAASIRGVTVSEAAGVVTEPVSRLTAFFVKLSDVIDAIPPIEQSMRFGNKAFRDWHVEMKKETPIFLNDFLPDEKKQHVEELSTYLQNSFGNEIRLDYGTGHESFVVIFFHCLYKLEIITNEDLRTLILSAFVQYMRTVRKLQTVYLLEPAGSHGVWGLDDYQCLVFLWGAAQLMNDKDILPSSIHDAVILRENSGEYLYLEAISFIKSIKHGAPFAETSPMLNDISFLGEWGKVFNGLTRLYDGEVLNKFPVSQHFLFGDIFQATWAQTTDGASTQGDSPHSATTTARPSSAVGATVFRAMPRPGAPGAPPMVSTAAPWAVQKHNV